MALTPKSELFSHTKCMCNVYGFCLQTPDPWLAFFCKMAPILKLEPFFFFTENDSYFKIGAIF